jgi:hypothetical protein
MDDINSTLATLHLGTNLSGSHSNTASFFNTTNRIMPKRRRGSASDRESSYESERKSDTHTTQQPVDLIITALHEFIQQERKTNFSFLAQYSQCYRHQDELLVVSRSEADATVIRKSGGRAYNNWYTFTEPLRFGDFVRTVAIDALPGKPIAVENLVITEFGRIHKNERDAATWIRDTYCTSEDDMWAMRFSELQYEEQRWWWEGTGKAFRLLDLPLEMREAIYLQAIGSVVVLDVNTRRSRRGELVLGNGQTFGNSARPGRYRDPDIQRPNVNIMRVNRQIRQEATQVANRDCIKRFTTLRTSGVGPSKSPLTIWTWLKNVAAPNNFLRRLQLEMNATSYLQFIGIDPARGSPFHRKTFEINIKDLARIQNLEAVDFRFIGPEHELAKCPWGGSASCQRKWIDIFFIYAWNDLLALRTSRGFKYTMSGCIKDSTRNHWTRLLNDYRNNHTASIRLLKKSVQAAMTRDTSLECKCSYPCVGGPRLFQLQPHELRLIVGIQTELDKAYWDFED